MDLWVDKVKEKVKNKIQSLKKSKQNIILPLYCKMKELGNISKIFKQDFVLSQLIKY